MRVAHKINLEAVLALRKEMTEGHPKSGKEFEELVTWIHQCLHEKAVITPNDRILDIHSQGLRQIDITIRIKDGPTSFLGIVEIRDRSRPVGVDFVEQVKTKREAVGADAAFIVSSSGFCETAVEKARALNIRTFNYVEAISSDWMKCILIKEITQLLRKWDNVLIIFLEPSTDCIINPHQSIVERLEKDTNAPIFVTEQNEPKYSLPQIANFVFNKNLDRIFQDISVTERRRKPLIITLLMPGNEPPLFFPDASGVLRRLERFCLQADFWTETHSLPVQLSKYCNAGTGETLAEIASTTLEVWGGPHKFDIIAKFCGDQGSQLLLRVQKGETPSPSLKLKVDEVPPVQGG